MLSDIYIAGLFDGLGQVQICKVKSRVDRPMYRVTVGMHTESSSLAIAMQSSYGGSFIFQQPRSKGHKNYNLWRADGDAVIELHERIAPYMNLNIAKLTLARQCQEYKVMHRNLDQGFSPEQNEVLEYFFQRMKALREPGKTRSLVPVLHEI